MNVKMGVKRLTDVKFSSVDLFMMWTVDLLAVEKRVERLSENDPSS
jgi:hypothetical protein